MGRRRSTRSSWTAAWAFMAERYFEPAEVERLIPTPTRLMAGVMRANEEASTRASPAGSRCEPCLREAAPLRRDLLRPLRHPRALRPGAAAADRRGRAQHPLDRGLPARAAPAPRAVGQPRPVL